MTMDVLPSDITPVAIRRDGESAIEIQWSDGATICWTAGELRKACPCATCREKRRADESAVTTQPRMLPVLKAEEARPLKIETMQPVGTYAYNIGFTDGHSSGLYTFAMLRGRTSPETDYRS